MKKIIIICLYTSILFMSIQNYHGEQNNSTLSTLISKENLVRAAVLGIIIINKDPIIASVKNHPIITACCCGLIYKFAADSYKKHRYIKHDFLILALLQELYDLLLYASEISNIMMQISVATSRSFDINNHFSAIVKEVPYSFDELEKKAKHMLIKWKLKLKEKYPTLYAPVISRKKSNLQDVDSTITSFYEHPIETYQNACVQIAHKLKIILEDIQKLHLIESL